MKPASRTWETADAVHLLLRTTLGASPEQLVEALATTPQALVGSWADEARTTPSQPISAAVLALGREDLLRAAWIERLVRLPQGSNPLRERMALVWHGHFATSNAKVNDAVLLQRQIELFREHGLGDFRDLLARVLSDPAMLIWLDGVRNRKGAPNENLARELFELFTLGRGSYGESDVVEAARALTGWRVTGRSARFLATEFDDGIKSVLGRKGPFDVDALVEVTTEHPACATFLADRLAREFLSDRPSEAAREHLAERLVANGWNLLDTLEELLTSELFADRALHGARIASPVEFVVRAARALPLAVPATELAAATVAMGQALLAPPSVEGWHTGRAWIGAAGWIERERAAARAARAVDLAALPASDGSALLSRLLPGSEVRWAEGYLSAADEVDGADPSPLIRSLLTAPEFHLV